MPSAVAESPANPQLQGAAVRRGRVARFGRLLAYGVALAAAAQLVRTMDFSGVAALLRGVGPLIALALVPFAFQIGLEAASWRILLSRLGHSVGWRDALRINAGSEAARLALPGGAAAGDALRTLQFCGEARAPWTGAVAALTVRKICHLGTQGAYLALGAVFGSALFAALGSLAVPFATGTAIAAAALVLAAAALALALFHGSVAARVERWLTRATGGRFAAALERRREAYAAVDGHLRRLLGRHGSALDWNLLTALAGWLLEAAEAFILLRLLGAPVTAGEAVALEAVVSVARAAAFAVPGGIGVQDLGYHALLRGVAGEPVAAAFVLLKRARDVFWIGVGFLSRALWT